MLWRKARAVAYTEATGSSFSRHLTLGSSESHGLTPGFRHINCQGEGMEGRLPLKHTNEIFILKNDRSWPTWQGITLKNNTVSNR